MLFESRKQLGKISISLLFDQRTEDHYFGSIIATKSNGFRKTPTGYKKTGTFISNGNDNLVGTD